MHVALSSILRNNDENSLTKYHQFSLVGEMVYNRGNHMLSLFDPFVFYQYLVNDWQTLLNIPPLINHCEYFTPKLFKRLQDVTIIDNSTFPLPPLLGQFPKHLRSHQSQNLTKIGNILFILLTSTKTKARFDAIRFTWIKNLVKNQSRVDVCSGTVDYSCLEYFSCCLNTSHPSMIKMIVVGDEFDKMRGIVTLPALQGKTEYLDAQHRQLMIMKYIHEECQRKNERNCLLQNTHWVALVDDDTWVNVYRTLEILSYIDSKRSVIIGHILTHQESDRDLLYIAGGSGIFLTRSAFLDITTKLYETCPFCKYNDVTIGTCAAISDIERVHVASFVPFRPAEVSHMILTNVATIHYMSPDDMKESIELLENSKTHL